MARLEYSLSSPVKYRIFAFASATLLGLAVCAGQGSTSHTVTGIVTNAEGLRMEGACVSAVPAEPSAGASLCANTDQEGRFGLMLRPGRYLLRAKDEGAGYPDTMFALCDDPSAKFPEIVIADSDVSGVNVVLGVRGGVLDGTVRVGNSTLPISGAKVTISEANNPAAFVEVFSNDDGRFQFTVPAKSISVSVTASGYKPAQVQEFIISGGQHRTLDISLKKG